MDGNNEISQQKSLTDALALSVGLDHCQKSSNAVAGRCTINDLPQELIFLIFQRAIPPDILLDSGLWAGPNSSWSRALELKKTLTLVCRAWYSVGVPFLYENVAIRRFPQAFYLLRSLNSLPGNALVKLVKSLEVQCYIPFRGPVRNHIVKCLHAIFLRCTQIIRFSYSSQCRIPLSFFDDCSLPVHVTHLHLSPAVPLCTSQELFQQVYGQLRCLRISLIPTDSRPSGYLQAQTQASTIEFPVLETLYLEYNSFHKLHFVQTHWTLLSLTRLTMVRLVDSYVEGAEGAAMDHNSERLGIISFLKQNGGKLLYLRIPFLRGGDQEHLPQEITAKPDPRHLQQALDFCPRLGRLSLDIWATEFQNPRCLIRHGNLQWLDIFIRYKTTRLYPLGEGLPLLLGRRRFYLIPDYLGEWVQDFSPVSGKDDVNQEDHFEVDVFCYQLTKNKRFLSWRGNALEDRAPDTTNIIQDFGKTIDAEELVVEEVVSDDLDLDWVTDSDESGGSVADLSSDEDLGHGDVEFEDLPDELMSILQGIAV